MSVTALLGFDRDRPRLALAQRQAGPVDGRDVAALGDDQRRELNLVTKHTGCHGFCERGPLVALQPSGILYTKVKPGRVMFEIDGVNEDIAREALRLAAMKLPVKTRTVVREDW
mgnify:CR=1 FL=1